MIAAVRGEEPIRRRALAVLMNPVREFFYSPLSKLEATLQPRYNRNEDEMEFYEEYFRAATCYGDLNRTFELAEKEARNHGIAVLDAMHLAAANLYRCEQFITAEKPSKPMYRTTIVRVVALKALSE